MFGMNPYLMSAMGGYYGYGNSTPQSQPRNTGEGTSFTWNEDERRKARGAAMMQLGIGLLSGAGSGKIAEGLASGLQGFSQTMVDARERERARQRQESLDAMAREVHGSSMETSRLNRSVVQGQQENIEEDRQRADQQRQRRAVSIPVWVRDIEAELGPDSPEAKRARNYAMLGEDVDLERLERLHMEAVDQSPAGAARRASRYQEETGLAIDRVQDQKQAGFGPLVDTAQNRERISQGWAGIDLQRQQESRMREWGPQGYGGAAGVKPGAYADDVLGLANNLFDDWMRSQPKPGDRMGVGTLLQPTEPVPPGVALTPEQQQMRQQGKPVIYKQGPPSEAQQAAMRAKFLEQAKATLGGLYPQAPGGGGRPTMAPGKYVYKDGHMYRKTPQGLELVY